MIVPRYSVQPEVPTSSEAGLCPKARPGALIMNADDWGRDHETTGRTLECMQRGAISSISAMVFMEDSDRAAVIARERGLSVGLHLNFTTPFSFVGVPRSLSEHQRRVSRYLLRHRLAQLVFHPALASSFRYLVSLQLEEFARLYGEKPSRIDGHHHMHLCSNVLLAGLLPPGTVVRRNFSFQRGEKSLINRLYRRFVDRMLAKRHLLTDFFFALLPLRPTGRLERIFSLARQFVVEVETHPVNPEEYCFLAGGGIFHCISDLTISRGFSVPWHGCNERVENQ